VGYNLQGTVSGCYSMGCASGQSDIGGLIAYSFKGTIKNCYSTCLITGSENVGGLFGDSKKRVKVSNCYFYDMLYTK